MPTLVLRCLGPLEIRYGDAPLEGFATRKERALLLYLACHAGQPFSREHLQSLLWSESTPDQAARSLRQALVNLRRVLPKDYLLVTRGAIAFNAQSDFELDLARFEAHPHEVHWYRGHFLQGFDLRGAAAWEEWLQVRREQLQARALGTLESLGRHHIARGEYAIAADLFHRVLAIDPWRETAYQSLMLTHALDGDRAAALAQYEKCRAALASGLGVEPLPETEALYQRILDHELTALDGVSPTTFVLPLVGRGDAYEQLMAAWQESRRQGCRLTLIEGEAGLGKTRLIEEVLRQAAMQGAFVLRGQCIEFAAEVPYRPIVQALRALAAEREAAPERATISRSLLAELARLLPELRDRYPDLPLPLPREGEAARQRLFEAVAHYVRACAAVLRHAARPRSALVFFLDDLHWADVATLDLLNHLVHSLAAHEGESLYRVWFVGTYRPEEISIAHPLARLWQNLEPTGLCRRVLLAPLSDEAIGEIAAWLSDDPTLRSFLQRESGGNPFALNELLRELQEMERLLPSPTGRWMLRGDLRQSETPRRVEEITLRRVRRLPPQAQRLINFAVILGEPFTVELLADVVGEPQEALAESLEEWQRRRLLQSDAAGRYDFTHDKIQSAIYHQLAPDLRKLLHEHVAQTLLDSAGGALSDRVAAQIAYHFEHSLSPRRALPYLAQAAQAAKQVYAHETAIDYYQRMLPLATLRQQVEFMLELADLHHLNGRWAEAAMLYQQTATLADQVNDWRSQARAWNHLSSVQANRGDYRAMLDSTERAEQAARAAGTEAQAELGEALHWKGWVAYRLGDLKTALTLAEEALALVMASSPYDRPAVSRSLQFLGSVHSVLGRYDQAIYYFDQARSLERESGNRRGEGTVLNSLGEVARLRGHYQTAIAHYEDALIAAREVHDRPGEISRLSNVGGARLGLGEYHVAESGLRQLLAMPEASGWAGISETHRFLAEACLGQGKWEEALPAARRALSLAQAVEQRDMMAGAWRVLGQVLAQLEAGKGTLEVGSSNFQPPTSNFCFAESLRLCVEAGMEGEQAWTLWVWAQHEREQGDPARGERLMREAQALAARLGMMLEPSLTA